MLLSTSRVHITLQGMDFGQKWNPNVENFHCHDFTRAEIEKWQTIVLIYTGKLTSSPF